MADFYLLLRPLCQKVRQLDAPAKLKVEMTREPATVNNEMTPELATVNNVLYCVGCSTLEVFLYLCFSRVGISSGSLSEPPFSLIEKMFKVEGNSFVCNVISHFVFMFKTNPEGMIERDAITLVLPQLSPFFHFSHFFLLFATLSPFLPLFLRPAASLPACVCCSQEVRR